VVNALGGRKGEPLLLLPTPSEKKGGTSVLRKVACKTAVPGKKGKHRRLCNLFKGKIRSKRRWGTEGTSLFYLGRRGTTGTKVTNYPGLWKRTFLPHLQKEAPGRSRGLLLISEGKRRSRWASQYYSGATEKKEKLIYLF